MSSRPPSQWAAACVEARSPRGLFTAAGPAAGDPTPPRPHRPVVRRVLVAVGWLASMVALVALASLLGGRRREVSIDVWIAVVATWLALLMLNRVTEAVPLVRDRLRNLPDLDGTRRRTPTEGRPGPELVLEGLLISARDNDRAMALRLRPRLAEIGRHLLRTRHGLDLDTQREQVATRLGDLFWLIDERSGPARTARFDEIERLLDLLLDPPTAPTTA